MNGIIKSKKNEVPTTVRFEPDQLETAQEMKINVSEVCRQALTREIKYQRQQLAMLKMYKKRRK